MTLTCSDNKTKLNSSQRNLEYSQDENYLTINYKKIKKKNIASVDLYFPFILFYLWILCESAAAKIEKCDAATQQSIFQNLPQCEPRTSLVDLRQFFVDNQDIIQVVPDHVMVHRCGGSCYMEAYDCIPTKTSVRTVEVMLVQSKWPHGQHEVHCSQLEVEVHDKCNCGCKLKKENCNKYQYYHESSCRCICNNTEVRSACIAANKVWDPDTCQCYCPKDTIQSCPTGYMFDFVGSCSCVPYHYQGGPSVGREGLIAGIVILLFLTVTIITALVIMHQQKTGLFKRSSNSNINSRRSTNESLTRTVLMSQESKNEYEKANKEGSVTLIQFDLSKTPVESQRLM